MDHDCLLNIQNGGMNYFDDGCDDIIVQKVHLHIQQRNGRKSWTHIKGLDLGDEILEYKKMLKKMRGVFACGGNVEEDLDDDKEIVGFIITLQGDKRNDVCDWLVKNKLAQKDNIIIHG
tara:strand:- start:346 stop:702 length:357 start_codon:yes stop_codon:yes gene_type:complete